MVQHVVGVLVVLISLSTTTSAHRKSLTKDGTTHDEEPVNFLKAMKDMEDTDDKADEYSFNHRKSLTKDGTINDEEPENFPKAMKDMEDIDDKANEYSFNHRKSLTKDGTIPDEEPEIFPKAMKYMEDIDDKANEYSFNVNHPSDDEDMQYNGMKDEGQAVSDNTPGMKKDGLVRIEQDEKSKEGEEKRTKRAAKGAKDCVKTEGGNSGGACCVFPFLFKGKEQNKCITAGHHRLWCKTTRSGRKKWGNCVKVKMVLSAPPPTAPSPTAPTEISLGPLPVAPPNWDLKIYTRPVVGDPVFLGDLYNSNTHEVLTGYSLWKDQTILNHKKRKVSPSSFVDVFTTRSTSDRLQRAGFSSSLKLGILGDMVILKGSAGYFKDRLESEKEVAVVLNYQTTTVTETLPVSTPKDFNYCRENGPTHVITSITYGIRANFVFKKTIDDEQNRDEIEKDLKIAVNAVPAIKSVIPDSINESVKNVRVAFYADFVSKKQPTSYQESVNMYQSFSSRVGKYTTKDTVTLRMKLMPITKFCPRKKVTHIAIAKDILNSVNEMLGDIEKTKLIINSLKMEQAVRNFLPLTAILQILFKAFTKFELQTKTNLRDILPRIRRGGNSSEEDLILLVKKYAESPFHYDNIKTFLDKRRREIGMLNYIIDPQKLKGTDMKLCTYTEASDIKIMFIKSYVLMLRYNVLPSKVIVNKFLKGETVDESKAWYNNPYIISAMGVQFKNFVRFSSSNTDSKTHGFLLAIMDAKKDGVANDIIDDVIQVNAQKEGLLHTFQLPDIPPAMTQISNSHNSITFSISHPNNTWVTKFSVSYWLPGKQDEMVSKVFRYSENQFTTLKIEDLTANNLYWFSMQYVTSMGSSAPSPSISFYTRPCSSPSNLQIATLGAAYFTMDWDAPSTCGKGVRITKYRVTVNGDGDFSKTMIVKKVTTVEIQRLQPGSEYHVSIEAIAHSFNATQNVLTTLPSSSSLYTRPDAPSYVSLVNVSTHSAVIEWSAPKNMANGSLLEEYMVKYVISNSLGNRTIIGTEMVMPIDATNTLCRLTDLIQGTTYAVSVQALTSKGDSDFSTKLLMTTKFVKSELDVLRDSFNHSVALIESKMEKQMEELDDRIDTTDVSIKAMNNIPTSMVYYPRLRAEGPLINKVTGCGGTLNEAGILSYPPGTTHYQYRYYEDCTWNIKTGLPLTISVYNWNVYCRGQTSDSYEWLSFYDEETLVRKSCYKPSTLHFRSGNVYVRFHNMGGSYSYGFKFYISVSNTIRMAGQKYYSQFQATFKGYGSPKSYSETYHHLRLPKTNSSIPACIEDCNKKYVNDHAWSGVSIELDTNPIKCSCYKKPVGFTYSLSRFNYEISGSSAGRSKREL